MVFHILDKPMYTEDANGQNAIIFIFITFTMNILKIHEPSHEKMRSLISACVVRYLDSIISLDSVAEISRL